MGDVARRGFLRGLAAAPLGAHVAAEQAKAAMLGAASGSVGMAGAPVAAAAPMKLTSFASWLKLAEGPLRRDAKRFQGFDADILEMRLPLVTKMRMQSERNYQRMLAEKREWFDSRLSLKGFVEWWA